MRGRFRAVATTTFDIEAVRRRFSALDRDLVLFDGPGGTQVPDEVGAAVVEFYRTSNANLGGPFETSRRAVALVDEARATAGRFLGCTADEVTFGANMTSLSFALSRTAARELEAGDEIVVTGLDHDGNVAPWLELAHDLGLEVRFAEITDDCDVDLASLESLLSERTRVVAFPIASNAVGTLTDVPRIVELAHSAGALAWADAVHSAPHLPTDARRLGRGRPALLAVQVLRASPRDRLRETRGRRALAPVQGAPAVRRAARPQVRDRDAALRAARRLRRRRQVHGVARLGGDPGARARARRAVPRGPARLGDALRQADDGRPGADVRVHGRRHDPRRGRSPARRAGHRRLGRELLRARGDPPARSRGGRRHASAWGSSTTTRKARSTGCSRR